ncbi:MAG: hypothetical protein QW035_00840 [Candidatus Anstonellales archaeon]
MVLVETVGAIALASGIAIACGAIATAYAQASIGSAAMGVIAEKPESSGMLLIYLALPETILILSFIVAFLLTSEMKNAMAAAGAGEAAHAAEAAS